MNRIGHGKQAAVFALSAALHALPLAGLWQWAWRAPEAPPEPDALTVEMVRLAPPEPPSERPPGPVQTEATARKAPPRHVSQRVPDASVEPLKVPPPEEAAPLEKPSDAPPAPATTAPASKPAPPAPKAVSASPDWRARLLAHIEQHKRYPAEARIRRQQGAAVVCFTVDAQGKVLSRRLVRSSGVPSLDAEALRVLRAASPLPVPAEAGLQGQEIVVVLEFFIR